MEKLVGSLFSCRSIVKSAIVETGVKPPHSKARVARETAITLPSLRICDSLLIKSAAIAFLHEDDRGSRSNLRPYEAVAAFLGCWRAWLGHPNNLQPNQHCRVARRVSHAFRAHVGAGAENFGADAEPLWTESRGPVRSFPTSRGRHKNVDQGRHRSGTCRQGCAFSCAGRSCRGCDPHAGRDSIWPKYGARRDKRRHTLFLRRRIGNGTCS